MTAAENMRFTSLLSVWILLGFLVPEHGLQPCTCGQIISKARVIMAQVRDLSRSRGRYVHILFDLYGTKEKVMLLIKLIGKQNSTRL